MTPPTLEQFTAALRDRSQRAALRLQITDADAATLLTHDAWVLNYYREWIAVLAAADAEKPVTVPAEPAADLFAQLPATRSSGEKTAATPRTGDTTPVHSSTPPPTAKARRKPKRQKGKRQFSAGRAAVTLCILAMGTWIAADLVLEATPGASGGFISELNRTDQAFVDDLRASMGLPASETQYGSLQNPGEVHTLDARLLVSARELCGKDFADPALSAAVNPDSTMTAEQVAAVLARTAVHCAAIAQPVP